jgi:RNA polymerase sigma factor (TIGR02999 family)
MRRILIEQARHKQSQGQGGQLQRIDLDEALSVAADPSDELLALDEALGRFESIDPVAARLVKLRSFARLTVPQAARALGVAPSTADRWWAYARAWLHAELNKGEADTAD